MNSQDEVALWVVKQGAKEAVKSGAAHGGIPPSVQKGLADQLSFAWDLVKKGHKITPAQLSTLLIAKGIGIGRMAMGHQYECYVSIAVVCAGLAKAVAFAPTGAGALLTAIDLLRSAYELDRSCKLSDAVGRKVDEVTAPAATWLEVGVTQWLMRGTGW